MAFAPARGLVERAGSVTAPQAGYYARRERRSMRLPRPISEEVFFAYRVPLVIEAHLEPLSHPGHAPLLLIEGEREPAGQRAHLARLYDRIAEPKDHLTLRGADHYANVADLGVVKVTSRATMDDLIDASDRFLSLETG